MGFAHPQVVVLPGQHPSCQVVAETRRHRGAGGAGPARGQSREHALLEQQQTSKRAERRSCGAAELRSLAEPPLPPLCNLRRTAVPE